MALQKRSARHIHRHCLVIAGDLSRPHYLVAAIGQVQPGQLPVVPHRSAVGNQLIENPGEELLQDLSTTRQQRVDMPALWYAAPVSGIVGQLIPLDHRDGPEVIGEHSGGEQPAHARAENDRTLTQYRHGEPLTRRRAVESSRRVKHPQLRGRSRDGFGHLVRYFAHDRRVGGISHLDTQVANLRLSHRPIPVLARVAGCPLSIPPPRQVAPSNRLLEYPVFTSRGERRQAAESGIHFPLPPTGRSRDDRPVVVACLHQPVPAARGTSRLTGSVAYRHSPDGRTRCCIKYNVIALDTHDQVSVHGMGAAAQWASDCCSLGQKRGKGNLIAAEPTSATLAYRPSSRVMR